MVHQPVRLNLIETLRDARSRTLKLIDGLSHEQLMGPRLDIVNPMRWEVGHVAWFQEYWFLRHYLREPMIRGDADRLYDSARVAHETRWDLPLPTMVQTRDYMNEVLSRVVDRINSTELTEKANYFGRLVTFHEDMHGEALTYTRQTLAYPPPDLGITPGSDGSGSRERSGPLAEDAEVPGGKFVLGATPDLPFVFDNEKWAHVVEVTPFHIARAPVTNAEFAQFVESAGYQLPVYWDQEGWNWRCRAGADRPVYWERAQGGGFKIRRYDSLLPLPEYQPVIHVNAYEAEAYCRWAGRRLPTEAEWELAACGPPEEGRKPLFPWGDDPPTAARTNLDGKYAGCVDVSEMPEGDSPFGCRQMIGNVWEWTSTNLKPYPGFVIDPYKEYSEPWFHSPHRVLRGGCWATRSRLLRNTWRNFYPPDRRDVFAGFRTCR